MRAFTLVFYFGLFLFLSSPAFAYLDPGTGSLLLYAVVGIAATVLFAIRSVWYTVKGRSFLAGSAAVSAGLPDLVLHSEGSAYWRVFEPVIAELSRKGASCAYVTPDPLDPGLACTAPGLKTIRPGGNLATIAWMNAAKAAVVVSTTPHLDVYMLRRSRGVRKYVHLFHSPTDVSFYEKYAFDWYDCLLTVGPFQERGIRGLEQRRRTPPKELLPTGCTYFDGMMSELARAGHEVSSASCVLYAPSWGTRSSVLRHGSGIIDTLTRHGMKVIFRPHPQFYVSHIDLIRDIEKRLENEPLVEIDRARTPLTAMARSDLLITDLSGILFDYACLFARPVLLANSDVDAGGFEGEDMPAPLWDVVAGQDLAWGLVNGLESLPDLVRKARTEASRYEQKAREFRERSFYNFGHAGPAAASHIMNLLQGAA